MLNARIHEPTGNLVLSLDMDSLDEVAEMAESRGYWQTMAELFEDFACNGGYVHFDAGQANPFVGLTSAPCIAESMDFDGEGNQSVSGRLWWFPNYAIRDDLAELISGAPVVYEVAA